MVSPDERPRKRQKEEEKAEVEQNGVKDDSPVVKQAKTEATKVEEGKQDKPSEVATDQALEDIGDVNEIGTTKEETNDTPIFELFCQRTVFVFTLLSLLSITTISITVLVLPIIYHIFSTPF